MNVLSLLSFSAQVYLSLSCSEVSLQKATGAQASSEAVYVTPGLPIMKWPNTITCSSKVNKTPQCNEAGPQTSCSWERSQWPSCVYKVERLKLEGPGMETEPGALRLQDLCRAGDSMLRRGTFQGVEEKP